MRPEAFHPDQFVRGQKHTLDLEFTAGGVAIRLPLLLARGAQEGKRLVVTAGVHGDEYEGVRALFEAFNELNPSEMSGDLLAVPVANPPAFWSGTRVSPLDEKNLARVFPGDAGGSPTAAIAHHLDRSILAHADFYLDLHSAGVKCLMPSMVGYDASDSRSRDAAFAFGATVVWAHATVAPGRTVSSAKERGIPFLYTEARGAGRIHADDLLLFRRGIFNLLRHLAILPGAPETVPCRLHLLGDGNIDESVSSSQRGFLVPVVELLESVRQGQQLGTLLDMHGRCLESFASPSDGVVGLIHVFPVVHPGEPIFLVTGVHP